MATKVSKAARIRALIAEGVPDKEIAEQVGCKVEYVRVAGHQRGKSSYYSPADLRYYAKRYGVEDHAEIGRRRHREYRAKRSEETIERIRDYQRAYGAKRYKEDAEFREKSVERGRLRRKTLREARITA